MLAAKFKTPLQIGQHLVRAFEAGFKRDRPELGRLLALAAANTVLPHVGVQTTWTEVAAVARRLLDQAFVGKAVLHF